MKQKLLLIILFACMSGMAAFAQSVQVSGRVTTSGSVPLPGANIAVKGASRGVISDDDGKFSITVPARATLVISHIGFSTRLVPVKGQTNMIVSLDSATKEMDNVVVIGYQTASRKSVSTSISSVSAKDIESYTTGNVANTLQGKVPGLQVVSGGGLPGAQPKILIHGLSSINYNNNPLIIVMGWSRISIR